MREAHELVESVERAGPTPAQTTAEPCRISGGHRMLTSVNFVSR
ncbi:hypothetical protein K60_008890 [Mycobacterium tuberculosis variant bovis BCG str. Korea 1168P]|nr:hypothetical protein K60_008890 [Mycobacterium tuberculosis variant bovis BCG str. Korea 1168P]AHM06557.1 hypothetical protein BCGT_0636 [Mycobacterium tuberculosis variant bovis BCG str. ATCC 35743]AIB47413.1 hypothetical protein MTBK_08670 [Mycobacterium tuberculosis K]AKO23830.1 hypothetical protein GS11_0904 [Mycobacterium tuberculosis variant bovis BCG]AKR00455.1 hypothetical protein Mb1595_p0932 [Mycobacterium tuberculosis variant bovis]ALB17965.1 Hypothetical protein AFL40_0865 [Myco